ncbi:MAG: glycosyl transferase [Nitrospirae bacterium]|nr:glycosyl transferase [Nitrospirota bacterium]
MGIFRFTIKASAQIAGIPYDSLACGCMIPDSQEVLGFVNGERGREAQQIILNGFYRYAAIKTSMALAAFGLEEISDIRYMLKGKRTFLWDFPEFLSLSPKKDIIHVGPILWKHWPYDKINIANLNSGKHPLAVVAFGTCAPHIVVIKRITRILLELGFEIILAAGGQKEILNIMPDEPLVTACNFAPFYKIIPLASLIVSHGGQMTVFEALQNKVPVLVMPSQPEQAHSGACLERIGCGRRLVAPQLFQGNPDVFIEALARMSDNEIKSVITGLVNNPQTTKCLAGIKKVIKQYKGVEKLATMLEAGKQCP